MARTSTARTKKSAVKKTAARKAPKTSRKKATASAGAKKTAPKKAATRRKAAHPAARIAAKPVMKPKWIEGVDQHEDRAGQSLVTRSHEVIQNWAEERGAQPATVAGSSFDEKPGLLQFNFPGFGEENLETISWDDWFGTFDTRELLFVYQEHLKNGSPSNFFRLDNPEQEPA